MWRLWVFSPSWVGSECLSACLLPHLHKRTYLNKYLLILNPDLTSLIWFNICLVRNPAHASLFFLLSPLLRLLMSIIRWRYGRKLRRWRGKVLKPLGNEGARRREDEETRYWREEARKERGGERIRGRDSEKTRDQSGEKSRGRGTEVARIQGNEVSSNETAKSEELEACFDRLRRIEVLLHLQAE